MKRVLLLTAIAIITFVLFALLKNPELLNKIWIWLIGFAGLIIQSGKSLIGYFSSFFDDKDKNSKDLTNTQSAKIQSSSENTQSTVKKDINTVQLSLLRFHDDSQTTLGLLYINNDFYCYTLEDTKRNVKIDGETRIPEGTYEVGYLKEETDMTKKYRAQFPDWFTFHLQINKVPNFSNIYIHNGGTHKDTRGCILVSDSLNISKDDTFLSNSKQTFEMLYKYLSKQTADGKKIMITVKDEAWASKITD